MSLTKVGTRIFLGKHAILMKGNKNIEAEFI
jgi:hypothetical protein